MKAAAVENRSNACGVNFSSSDSSVSIHAEESESTISLSIECIENIIRSENLTLKFVIEHDGHILGESEEMIIESSFETIAQRYEVDLAVTLPYSTGQLRTVSTIVSTPILIKAIEVYEEKIPIPQSTGKGKSKNVTESRRSSQTKIESRILGLCTLDLLPVVLGEAIVEEKLVLEVPVFSWNSNAVSWANLPRITVNAELIDPGETIRSLEWNIMNITVESIYNLPALFGEEMDYRIRTILRTDSYRELEENQVSFEGGKWTDYHDVERTKVWSQLQSLESRARFSKYKINADYDIVKNHFKKQFDLKVLLLRVDNPLGSSQILRDDYFNAHQILLNTRGIDDFPNKYEYLYGFFQYAVTKDEPRIEWNSVNRFLLDKECAMNIQDRVKKCKYWAFEIWVSEKPGSFKEQESLSMNSFVYQCYVDTSELLFPGTSKTRVVAQLYHQSSLDSEENNVANLSSFDEGMFFIAKCGPNASLEDILRASESFSGEGEEQLSEILPVFGVNGDPVLIVIEFELYRPFVPARVLEDYTEALEVLRNRPRPKRKLYSYTPDLVYDQYINCIKHLVDVIGENYHNFLERCDCREEKKNLDDCAKRCEGLIQLECKTTFSENISCPYFYIQDELSRFRQFLHESGQYISIRSTLKNKIINLLDQKFALNSTEWYSPDTQNLLSTCYTYLVDEMQSVLNSKLEVRFAESIPKPDEARQFWARAEEAVELGNFELADRLLTKIIYDNKKNANSWMRYAIYSVKNCNQEEAVECCREVIRLCSRHCAALIFYGAILAVKQEYTDAEIFLKAVTHFYPRFAEGWAILHLFYIKIQYYPGIDLTLEIAEKCLKDRIRDNPTTEFFKDEPFSWSTMLCRSDRIFLLTATLLLRLNLYHFASLALTQELCHNCKSVEALYFLAVNKYLQYKFEAALEYLFEAESIIGLEYSVSALAGHSLLKLGKVEEAVKHYEAVDMLYERPEDIHLVHIRMGFYYIDVEDYERARNVFLRACKYSPSCKTWLGVGAACYYLGQFSDSELALTEANHLDGEDAEVWGYLCLLNMSLHRQDEFTQCYRQTVKNNLRSDKLWRLITHSMDTLGYSSPITVLEDSNDSCVC